MVGFSARVGVGLGVREVVPAGAGSRLVLSARTTAVYTLSKLSFYVSWFIFQNWNEALSAAATLRSPAAVCRDSVPYCTVLYRTALYCSYRTVLYRNVLCCMLCCTLRHYYCVQYCAALCCTTLHRAVDCETRQCTTGRQIRRHEHSVVVNSRPR